MNAPVLHRQQCTGYGCTTFVNAPASADPHAEVLCPKCKRAKKKAEATDYEDWEGTTLADVRGNRRSSEFYNEGQKQLAKGKTT